MRNFLLLLFFFQNGIICSQIFKGVIKYNNVKFTPSEYATILNKTNYNYTFSDSLGNFTISAKINDTLEINNLNTERTNYIINKLSDTIIVTEHVNLLMEVSCYLLCLYYLMMHINNRWMSCNSNHYLISNSTHLMNSSNFHFNFKVFLLFSNPKKLKKRL